LAVLQSTVGRLGARTLLLVTENMDQTFHSLGDSGQKKWRAFLQETRKIATLATAQQLFSGVSDRNEAFFGFFDIQHLKPLSVDEAVELITRISVEHSNRELIRYLKSAEGQFRIRALHYLAGGNHRMYVLLSEFLTKESLDDLVAAFDSLANDMTPFFQERIRALPDQQRQLVQCLCDAQGALTVKEIASETFIDERVCSKQLGNLKDKGYVRSEKRGKESYYDMSEPLMRLCLEVKNQHGRPLRLLARFLRAWFPVTELESKLNGNNTARVSEYCKLAIESVDGFKGNLALIDHYSLEDLKAALARAFNEGARETSEYGGAPHDLLWMVLGRSPAQWANYISVIASMYIEHGCADKLGQGITKSIQHLDEGGFSKSQIESWNAAWQQAGRGSDALEIPLRCLDVAVEVMNSDPRSDRALFRLPLELRGLIRPLLNRSLGDP
jgi:hypothetical protein